MINRILIALCLISTIFTSCRGQKTPSSLTDNLTLSISEEPSPSQGSFPVVSLTGEITEFATFDSGFQELSPGTYMLVRETDEIYYYSLDGLRLGKVVSLKPAELSFSDYRKFYRYSGNPQSPSLYVIYENHSGQVLAQILDLKTGETHVWQANINESAIDSESIYCDRSYSSPSGRWLAGDCKLGNRQFIYLIDLLYGTGRFVFPPLGPCYSYIKSGSHWWPGKWSPDESLFFVHCQPSSGGGESRGCLINMQSQEFTTCREPFYDYLVGWSPDGSKVALESGTQEFWPDENTHLYVINAPCLTDSDACERYVEILIGYDFSSSIWDSTGEKLIWVKYPLVAKQFGDLTGIGNGYSTIGVSDITSGTTSIITQGAPKGSGIEKLSPDGKWIILKEGGGDWWRFKLESKSLRRLFQVTGDSKPSFLGWLVIP